MKIIQTLGDLQDLFGSIGEASRGRRVDCWYMNTGKTLVYVGPSGENTDSSFNVYDTYEEAVAAIASGEQI